MLIIRIEQLVTTLYKLVPGNICSSNYIPTCLIVASIPFSVNRATIFSLNVIKTFSVILTCMSWLRGMYSYCRSTTCCRPGGRDPRMRAPLSLSTALIQSFVHLSLYSRNNGIISVPCRPLRTLN